MLGFRIVGTLLLKGFVHFHSIGRKFADRGIGGMSNHHPRWAIHARIWARGYRVFGPHFLPLIVVLGLNLSVVGCAGTGRLPAEPLSVASKISVEIPDVRFYPDTDKQRMAVFAAQS